jgi:predicted RNA methylase
VIKALMAGEPRAEVLKGYTGWGGMKRVLEDPAVYDELQAHLTGEEIELVRKTVRNAYYTPAFIVKAMFEYLEGRGFTGGRILEPSAGAGVFIEYMPEAIRKHSRIYAVEIEPVSARILAGLYPDVTVRRCGFETLDTDVKFDLVVGNPPYGKDRLYDERHLDLKELAIHHFFAAKSMRLLKDGGILAMVLPSYFMDNGRDHAREIIANEGGYLLDAFRLPDDCFDSAKVTVDLVFLRKGGGDEGAEWVNTDRISVNSEYFRINKYFNENRHRILGDLSWVAAYGRKQLSCVASGGDLEQKLNEAVRAVEGVAPVGDVIPDFDGALQAIQAKMERLEKARARLLLLRSEYETLMQEIKAVLV